MVQCLDFFCHQRFGLEQVLFGVALLLWLTYGRDNDDDDVVVVVVVLIV